MTDTKKPDDDLMAVLEKAIKKILLNPKSKPGEISAAVANGVRLLGAKHKISGGDDAADFFN